MVELYSPHTRPDHILSCKLAKKSILHHQETAIVQEWRKRSPLLHPAYRDDDTKAMSGLGCAWGANDLSGDFLSADAVLMTFSRVLFEQLIWSEFGGPNHVD